MANINGVRSNIAYLNLGKLRGSSVEKLISTIDEISWSKNRFVSYKGKRSSGVELFYLRINNARRVHGEGKPDSLALLKTKLIEDERTSSLFASTPTFASWISETAGSRNFAIGDFGLIRGKLIIEITKECRRFFFFFRERSFFHFVIIFL